MAAVFLLDEATAVLMPAFGVLQKRFGTRCRINSFLQRLPKQSRLALTERVHCIRVLRVMLRSFRKAYAAGQRESFECRRSAVVHRHRRGSRFDIERLKGQTMPLRPPPQERIENRFPRSRVDARRIGQHAIKIEDRGVEVAPAYRD